MGAVSKIILWIWIFLGIAQSTYAQFGIGNPIPKNIYVDLADLNAKEYKSRFKQYKDTIRFLGKLEKQTLVKAKKVFKELPVEEKHKVKLKNLESDVELYKGKLQQMQSMDGLKAEIIKLPWAAQLKESEIGAVQDQLLNIQGQVKRARQYFDEHMEQFSSPDSMTLWQKMQYVASNEQLRTEFQAQTDIDPQQYLTEMQSYRDQLGKDTSFWELLMSDSTITNKVNQMRQLADQHFGGYEEYLQANEQLKQARGYLDQAKEYRSDIESILNGDFEKLDQFSQVLEARAMKIEAMREAADELGQLKQYEEDIRRQIEEMRYKADLEKHYEEHLKGKDGNDLIDEAIKRGQQMAGDHFKGQEKLLTSAQQELGKVKAGSFNFGNADNMEVIKPNSLEGESLGKRLVIGGNLQIARQEEYTGIDFSPVLGYRWNKRYMWGIGGTYRAKVNEDERSVLKDEQVYGGRFFMEYSLGRIFAHGEYELISHGVVDPQTDLVSRVNANGALLGAGINYNFMKKVNGNVMVLYNFLHDPLTSPYDKPILFRFGFSLDK